MTALYIVTAILGGWLLVGVAERIWSRLTPPQKTVPGPADPDGLLYYLAGRRCAERFAKQAAEVNLNSSSADLPSWQREALFLPALMALSNSKLRKMVPVELAEKCLTHHSLQLVTRYGLEVKPHWAVVPGGVNGKLVPVRRSAPSKWRLRLVSFALYFGKQRQQRPLLARTSRLIPMSPERQAHHLYTLGLAAEQGGWKRSGLLQAQQRNRWAGARLQLDNGGSTELPSVESLLAIADIWQQALKK